MTAAGSAGEGQPGRGSPDDEGTPAPDVPPRTARPSTPAEQTSDDTDVGWGETPESADARDRWLEEQRPPHWD
jgi:hypothetical protein